MNLSDMILIDRTQPPMSVDLTLKFGLIAPLVGDRPGRRHQPRSVDDDPDDEAFEPPTAKSKLEAKREAMRTRREAIVEFLRINGACDSDMVADAMGVNRSTAHDDLIWLRDARRATSVRRDGRFFWRAR